MTDQLVSFETAKLARGKGFEEPCDFFYTPDGRLLSNIYKYSLFECIVPTQSLLQKWLREKHNIHMFVRIIKSGTFVCWILNPMFRNGAAEIVIKTIGYKYKTYEEALEQGLQKALKLI